LLFQVALAVVRASGRRLGGRGRRGCGGAREGDAVGWPCRRRQFQARMEPCGRAFSGQGEMTRQSGSGGQLLNCVYLLRRSMAASRAKSCGSGLEPGGPGLGEESVPVFLAEAEQAYLRARLRLGAFRAIHAVSNAASDIGAGTSRRCHRRVAPVVRETAGHTEIDVVVDR